jgi:hypothetical protein
MWYQPLLRKGKGKGDADAGFRPDAGFGVGMHDAEQEWGWEQSGS